MNFRFAWYTLGYVAGVFKNQQNGNPNIKESLSKLLAPGIIFTKILHKF